MRRWPVLAFVAWAALLFWAALGLFARGFLLTRLELPQRSACRPGPPPWPGPGPAPPPAAASAPGGCWLPRRFARAVLVLIDALRFDFARWEPEAAAAAGPGPGRPFANRLPTLRRLLAARPRQARLYRFRADPPTTTLQRLKGLATGSLPTFVDAGSNFASHAVREDNLLRQLADNGKRVVFMGDDTWDGLFPEAFSQSYFFPSFNVKDLHTVDEGILQHLYPTVDGGEWELLIAHFLGVDHCGHKHGPDHPEMAKKLSQMDAMLRSLVDHLANDTLLLVAGDHGMTSTGDHGGESEDEVNAALFVYSKAPLFQDLPPQEPETVPQVNLVPTLALLLGVPIPYSNIGEVMADLFAVEGDAASSVLAQLAAYSVNAWQVNRFLHSYSLAAQDLSEEKLLRLQDQFSAIMEEYKQFLAQAGPPALPELQRLRSRFSRYLREARAVCAESWARFHPACMVAGCALLASSCLLCWVASQVASAWGFSYRHLLLYPLLWGVAGAALLGLAHLWGWAGVDFILLASWAAAASQCGFFWHCWARRSWRPRSTGPRSSSGAAGLRQRLWARAGPALPLSLLCVRCGAMLSDSFVMAEAQVVAFLLVSLVLLLVLRLHWEGRLEDSPFSWQLLGLLGGILACVRLSGLFRQCREETPHCRSSPVLAPLSSLQDPQTKNFYYMLCLAVLVGLAWGVRCWLRHYGNLNSPSPPVLFVRWGFPLLAICIGGYWAITSGAEEALVQAHPWVQLALVAFPQSVFVLVIAGLLLVLWDPVTVFVKDSREAAATGGPILLPSSQEELQQVIPQLYRRMQESLKSRLGETKAGSRATVAAYGLGSVYSAALLIPLALLGFLFMVLHTERLSLAFLLLFLEAFAWLWVHSWAGALASQADPFTVPWEALIGWALAAAQFFYATGHQPVFPAIHWNAAFVGFQQGHGANLIPALLVGANTFASHILFAAGCPLLLLWPFVCEMAGCQSRTPKSETDDGEEQLMEMRLREAPDKFSLALLQLGLKYLSVLGVQMLACVLAAMILRRHLMVWKVFAPKFVFETLGFVVSSIFLLLGIGLVMRVDCAVSLWFKQVILAQPR
ncbi:GPI ethanolamine phosphate transferase 3 [Eublepharis macularius]|uniref:GPI ethanolamine phosphate transferase 3, catalytic subunit n=1 Tax=Eublepharis macularius TaxID=481883 RepID=A0AA97JT07_EUBMA|nr:GPI ethanolamine phosphate transferase 3 [Eublepharis macularius]